MFQLVVAIVHVLLLDVSVSGRGGLDAHRALGKGGLGGIACWGFDPDAVWPGVGGLVGGWARLTRSSPNESDLLSDSGIWQLLNGTGINCVNVDSFAGNQVSLNFTSREIFNRWWAASQNWYPLEPGS